MKKICIIFGHPNSKTSFNSAVRDTFIEEAKKDGHKIDLINLFDEKAPRLYNAPDFSWDSRLHDPRGRMIRVNFQLIFNN